MNKICLILIIVSAINSAFFHVQTNSVNVIEHNSLRPSSFAVSDKVKKVTKTEIRITKILETIISEHNRGAKDESDQIRDFSIIESREKFLGEGGKLWARVILTFRNGVSEKYIFKDEMSYAMDEIGSETLKVLNIDMPQTRRYGNNYFLIKAIGQFNLNKIKREQYRKRDFGSRLAYLAGEAAARALIIGLADRKGSNLRVILDENNFPEKVLNVDLASAFTYTRSRDLKIAISECTFILTHILKAANSAEVESDTLREITLQFVGGFEKQFLEFQDNYTKIDEAFKNIDLGIYDRLDRMWFIMDNVKSKKDKILSFINPREMPVSKVKALLIKAILKKLSSFNGTSKLKIATAVLPLTAA